MLVGEIGFPRKEFLCELKWWEVKSIIRGYNVRRHDGWEQARLVAYNAHYCMGSKTTPPTVIQWLPFHWEKESCPKLSEEEVKEMQREMDEMNKMNKNMNQTND